MIKTENTDEVVSNSGSHVDCYVSTDQCEIDTAVFEEIGFFEDDFGYRAGDGILLDSEDISLDEARIHNNYIGFLPMSRIRITMNGVQNKRSLMDKTLVPLLRRLDELRQNIALVSDSGSHAYVKLSEFYR